MLQLKEKDNSIKGLETKIEEIVEYRRFGLQKNEM